MTEKKKVVVKKKMPKPFLYIFNIEIIYMVAVMTNPVEPACPSLLLSLLPFFPSKASLLGKTVDVEKDYIEE